jgi:hypothetical protein
VESTHQAEGLEIVHGRHPDRGSTSNRVGYEVGIAKYSELAKSMMLGDEAGIRKILFDRQTRKSLGVHALGQRATEIIPIGQAVLFYGGVGRILSRHGLQLSDARRSSQSSCFGRTQ